MVTPQALYTKPIMIELSIDDNIEKLQWMVARDDHGVIKKIGEISIRECIEGMMHDTSIIHTKTERELRNQLISYIGTEDYDVMIGGDLLGNKGGDEKVIDHLYPRVTAEGNNVWYQLFRVCSEDYIEKKKN